jgi:hypothetical protein
VVVVLIAMKTISLIIDSAGTITMLPEKELDLRAFCTDLSYRRVSHIWPVHPVKRIAFRLLRALFGERGRVAQWTRQWQGPWQAIIIDTGETFVHQSRRVCLDWEHEVINKHLK